MLRRSDGRWGRGKRSNFMNGSGKFFYGFSDIFNFTVFKCLLCCVGLYIFSLSISSLWWL